MTPSDIDPGGRSTIAASGAQAALAAGDTATAKAKYAEAGAFLEQDLAPAGPEQEALIRFLAATMYYRGGNYQKALTIVEGVKPKQLPESMRLLLAGFARDARERAAADYPDRIRQQLVEHLQNKAHGSIIDLLREHPYVLPPEGMAFLRATACESLGKFKAAAVFYASAIRMKPSDPGLVFTSVELPLTLMGEGKFEEAWEYVTYQLESVPHAITNVVASLLCFHRAATNAQGQARWLEQQQVYFKTAQRAFDELDPAQQQFPEFRNLMELGFEAAALGLLRTGDKRAAGDLCLRAIAFAPRSPKAWTVRGIIAHPADTAVDYFREALALGDGTYFPYYYLAEDALRRGDFPNARSWTAEALKRVNKQNGILETQLHEWLEYCQGALEELKPQTPYALNSSWDRRGIDEIWIRDREGSLLDVKRGTAVVLHSLELAAT